MSGYTSHDLCVDMPAGATRRDRQLYRQLAMALGGVWDIAVIHVRPWASATFYGARHCLTLRLADTTDAIARLNRLPEHEFRLTDAVVVDCCITNREPVLMEDAEGLKRALDIRVELLTIQDI